MTGPLVTHTGPVLRADPARVVTTVFLPGQEAMTPGISRATTVLDRVLALSDEQVEQVLADTQESFRARHKDLDEVFQARFRLIEHRVADPAGVSLARRQLVGAYFSQEFAVESAALFNPSMVAHPDQSGMPGGATRFVMSVRAVGEGHVSSIGWRTGVIDASHQVTVDPPGWPLVPAVGVPATYSKAHFRQQLGHRATDYTDSAEHVLAGLPDNFNRPELDQAMAALTEQRLTRGSPTAAIERLQAIAAASYSITFPAPSALDQRVIMPGGPAEAHGVEDLRLVRFTHDDGRIDYRGSYTAFDGSQITQSMLRTTDFRTFHSDHATGRAAQNKGLAVFPRAVGGRYLALSRWDREGTSLAASEDMLAWDVVGDLARPTQPWELVQVGNCGPPVETAAGWLVLTHGVGPMRQYGIGAMMLDLHDPGVVIGQLAEPLLAPNPADRDGYVPNVVYSCGAMIHGDRIVLPYGCNDSHIRFAVVDLPQLLAKLE